MNERKYNVTMNYKRLFAYSRLCAQSIVIACMVIACQQEEQNEEVLGDYITFSPTLDDEVVGDVSTRVEDIELKNFGFTVCGYESANSKFDAVAGSTYPNVFKGKSEGSGQHFQKVKYELDDVDSKQKFITKERPWVVAEENYLSFFAWSDNVPDAPDNGITGHSPATKTGYPTITIGVVDEITKHPDIVISRAIDLRNNALISAVDLQFKHLLSKISFKAYSSSGTSVKITSFNIKYGGTTYRKATYDLNPNNDLPFAFTDAAANKHGTRSYPIIATGTLPDVNGTDNVSPATAIMLGNMMQIPQDTPDDFLTAEITYQIKGSDNAAGPEITRNIPIKAMKLQQGFHYIFAFDFISTEVQISVNSIADWNEMGNSRLPLVAGPKGNLLLWLDAGDAPYLFNGSQYWLDRSGYNRHCKFVKNFTSNGTAMTYDAAAKVYKFTSNTNVCGTVSNYFQLPVLGNQKEITVQFLLKSYAVANAKDYQTPFFYSSISVSASLTTGTNLGTRNLLFNIYEHKSNGDIYIHFDWAKTIYSGSTNWERMSATGFTTKQENNFALLTFRRKAGFKAISRNLSYNNENPGMTIEDKAASLNYGFLGADFDGEIKMVKIYSHSIGTEQVEKDYESVKKSHKLPDDEVVPLDNLPRIQSSNLLAYFDALDEPKIYSATNIPEDIVQWRDRTGNGYHLQIYGYKKSGVSGITYDATNKCYVFNGDLKNAYMKLVKPLGALSAYSVEFYLSNDGIGSGINRVLLHFTGQDVTTSAYNGFIWYFPDKDNHLNANANDQYCIFNDGKSAENWSHTWGIGRSDTYKFPDQDRAPQIQNMSNFYAGRGTTNTSFADIGLYVPKLVHCYIGLDAAKSMPFKGKIKRIRIYKRAITPAERIEMKDEMKNGVAKKN